MNELYHRKPSIFEKLDYIMRFELAWFMKRMSVNMPYMCKTCLKWCRPIKGQPFFNMDISECNHCAVERIHRKTFYSTNDIAKWIGKHHDTI